MLEVQLTEQQAVPLASQLNAQCVCYWERRALSPPAQAFTVIPSDFSAEVHPGEMPQGAEGRRGVCILCIVVVTHLCLVFSGGMQDYNYVWADCFEITLELSCCKYPLTSELQQEWENNHESLLSFIEKVV